MQIIELPLDIIRNIAQYLSDIVKERNGKFLTTLRKQEAIYRHLFDNFRYRVMTNNHELLVYDSKVYSIFSPKFDVYYFRQLSRLKLNLDENTIKFYKNNIILFLIDLDKYIRKRLENNNF